MHPNRMASRLLNMLLPGRVRMVDDTGTVQRIQGDFGPTGPNGALRLFDKVPVVGLYGLASNPPIGADVVTVFLGGDPTSGVVVGANHQPSRLKNLGPGDAALYDIRGAYAWFTPTGLVVDAAGLHVTIQNADTVTVKASAKVRLETPLVQTTGDFVSRCDGTPVSLNGLRDAYDAHAHPGVQPGSGATGGTDHSV